MAALPTPDPRPDARAQASDDRLRLLRELGAQAVPAWAAIESLADASTRLVVVERAERKAFDDGEIADWIRDARRLSALDHPNVARVRDVIIRSGEILVVSEFVDGVRWREFATTTTLETALRVFVDALTGLSALHNMRDARDAKRQVFKLVHGGLTPDCVVVGLDGIARVVGASRPRSATARLAGTGSAYLAPEVLLEDDAVDARADVYSVGVMLWEALSQRRFLPNMQPSAIVTQLLSGRVPGVTLPEGSPWAAPLADVVTRALSADPEKRFSSAAAMAADLRRIGALKLPLALRVAAGVRATFGKAISARRAELERGEVDANKGPLRGSKPSPEELSIDVTDDVADALRPEASQTASTVPPPGVPREPGPELDEPRAVSAFELSPGPVAIAPPPQPAPLPPPPAPVATAQPLRSAPLAPPQAPVVAAQPLRPPPLGPPPAPVAAAQPLRPAPLAPPPAPEAVPLPPPAPVAIAAPPAPVAVVAPVAQVAVVAPVAPVAVAAPVAPKPSAPARLPIAITTAAPFALATPASLEGSEARATRPNGMLRTAAAAAAVLGIGAATWWIASRDAHPATVIAAPSATAQTAERPPHESAAETAAPAPVAPPLGATPASAPMPTSAGEPPPAIVNEPPAAPTSARAPAPAVVLPPKQRHPATRAYDPQGI